MDNTPPRSVRDVPDAESLRAKVTDVLSRDDYDIQSIDETPNWMLDVLRQVFGVVTAPFRWIYELSEGLPELIRNLIVIALASIVVLLIAHIIFTLTRTIRGGNREGVGLPSEDGCAGLSAVELEQTAAALFDGEKFIEGIRVLFQASLKRLEDFENAPFRRGTTNRQHLLRYRDTQLHAPMETLVKTIEQKWYGENVCRPEDASACRQATTEISGLLKGGDDADAS